MCSNLFNAIYYLNESCSWRGVLNMSLCDQVCQLGGFLWILPVSYTNKTDCREITEILLKVALNTITLKMNKDF